MTTAAMTAQNVRNGRPAMAVLLLTVFINLVGFGILIPVLPFYAQSLHAPAWQITWIFTAFSIGNFFAEPFWGRLSDRVGRKPILVGTIFCSGLGFIALAFAPNFWFALLFRFLGGLTTGNLSTIQGYIADVTPAEQRAGRMGLLGAAFGMGFVTGPVMGGLLAQPVLGAAGFRLPLLVAASLSFTAALGVLIFVKESRRRSEAGPQPKARTTLAAAARDPVIVRTLAISFLFTTAFAAAESTFGLWTQHRYNWGPWKFSLCLAAVAVTAAVGQGFLTGRLTRRHGEGAILATGLVLMAITLALQPLTQTSHQTFALLVGTALGQAFILPNIIALISRSTSAETQGAVFGLNQGIGALARATGPVMGGALFSIVGPNAPLITGAVLVAPAILLAVQAERAARNRRMRL